MRIFNYCMLTVVLLAACSPKMMQKAMVVTMNEKPLNVCIDSSYNFVGPCEPSICINFNDPMNIVAGSVLDNVYYSKDGGYNWEKNKLSSPYGVYGDPTIRVDGKGNFYYAHLSNPAGMAYRDSSFLDRIVVQKSMDNGEHWNEGSYTTPTNHKDQDKQWPAIDRKSNVLYMTWTEFDKYDSKLITDRSRILFSKSIDGATTWSDPMTISDLTGDCLDDDNTTEGAVPAVGPNGELYVSWALNEKIYFDRSLNGGEEWLSSDIEVVEQVGGWALDIPGIMRCNGMPVLGVDISKGKYSGDIYINWSDQKNGVDDTDIWIIKSSDRGEHWSDPIRVNNDKPGRHQFFSWMSIDPVTGYVYVVFYDRREHDDNSTDVYLAYSIDGGNSFENKKISSQSFLPNKHVFFGDYNDISSYNGMIRPIWTSLDGHRLKVWTAIVEVK